MELKKSTKLASGFDRVRKHHKKWQAWTIVNGKQKFLKDHEDPVDAAEELWRFENANQPTLLSPCPGHRHKDKRAPPCTHCTSLLSHTPTAPFIIHSQVCQCGRRARAHLSCAAAQVNSKDIFSGSTVDSSEPPWDAEELLDLVPLPGVPFLAYKLID